MAETMVRCARTYPFSPVIVWDALVDDVLVSGWWAEAAIDPVPNGRYALAGAGRATEIGRIERMDAPTRLVLSGIHPATIRFELTELPGGPRGTSTELVVTLAASFERAFALRWEALWSQRLARLDELLHGHPTDFTVRVAPPAKSRPPRAVGRLDR